MRNYCFLLFTLFGCTLHSQESSIITFQKCDVSSRLFSEYNFITTKTGAFFVSDYATVTSKKIVDSEYNNLTSIYYCSRKKKKFGTPRLVDIDFYNHIGSFYVNPEGNLILFSGRQTETATTFGIFKTEKIRGIWSKPVLLIKNMEQFNFIDPFVSSGGDTLYFSSDMPGGKGGLDLYMAKDYNSDWIKFENLGNPINSDKNERYPSIFNGVLYFSSNKSDGFGGFDLYSNSLINGKYDKNVLLAEPFNSVHDDFKVISDGKTFFFSSNRDGSDDVFELTANLPKFECFSSIPVSRCFEFEDEYSDLKDSLQYSYMWSMGDGATYDEIEVEHCYQKAGVFEVTLKIIDNQTNQMISQETSYELEIIDPVQLELDFPQEAFAGDIIDFKVSDETLADSSTYYWDLGDGSFNIGEAVLHKYQKTGLYTISVGRVYYLNGEEFRICTSKELKIQ